MIGGKGAIIEGNPISKSDDEALFGVFAINQLASIRGTSILAQTGSDLSLIEFCGPG